ncbi:undecaprenyl-phosphate galactose phosphotransferase WbaP [Almyronema epifaneia]|uniref:Undecaprenyl-phosphate galactose phosphotransferase WbaP n=1 Tax=Almyronema epifaneia S1 TaxID=2991925 RepID=A0ABW6IAQ3_9CYAN
MTLYRTLQPAVTQFKVLTRPLPTIGLLLVSDFLALFLASWLSVEIRLFFDGQFTRELYGALWPVLCVFIVAYGIAGLYPGITVSPVDELRRTSLTTTLIYLALGSAIFLFREGEAYSRSIFLMAWLLSIAFVLLGRFGLRSLFAPCRWWGYPVVVLGAGKTGEMVIRMLQRQPQIGLKPVAVLDDNPQKHGDLAGVPVIGGLSLAPILVREQQIPYAIAAMPGVPRERLLKLLSLHGQTFPHMLVIPDLFGIASLWVAARDLGGILGLEIRQQLLLPGPRLLKALLDYSLTLILGILALPLIGLIAIAVQIDSPGPIFYGHTRIGQNGKIFKAWKFRSMVKNSAQVLEQYLSSHPEAKALWLRDQKLQRDPRITRVGAFLRRTSLDELPQLWNVLRRQMSLVGPRPIITEEIWRYDDKFELYLQVLPGITGLWQVSGRNHVPYEERVNLDAYYVRNWSVWLDVYILIRTFWVVITGYGAY